MKILALADEHAKQFYEHYQPGMLKEYDLILACGDLSKSYLEFFVTMARCPVFYVHGNHDDALKKNPPEGCECIDGRLVVYQGVRILGLGGSYRYKDGENMYTEEEMAGRIRKLWFPLWKKKGFDILVSHAPAKDLNDLNDLSHRGFECFKELLKRYRPKYFVHGHVHLNYGRNVLKECRFGDTTVLNAYEYSVFEI